jgi:hypothetical protein
MSRRQHVVRTDDQGGIGVGRSLGGCTILCSHEDCGSLGGGGAVELAYLNVESSEDYQRCFVAATIGSVSSYIPDPIPPPGPGSWTVRFECPEFMALDDWTSVPYHPPVTNTVLTALRYERAPGEPEFGEWGSLQEVDDYYPFSVFQQVSGAEWIDAPIDFNGTYTFHVRWQYGPGWAEMSLTSPTGEGQENVVVTEGSVG